MSMYWHEARYEEAFTARNELALTYTHLSWDLPFAEFVEESGLSGAETVPLADARKLLHAFVKPRIGLTGYEQQAPYDFEEQFNHIKDVLIHKTLKDMLVRDYLQTDQGKDKTDISLKMVESIFFAPEVWTGPAAELKQPQVQQGVAQSKLMVGVNALMLAMQTYNLHSMRRAFKENLLDRSVYSPRVEVDGKVYEFEDVFVREDDDPVFQGLVNRCLLLHTKCYVDPYFFYMFKLLFERDYSFATEQLLQLDNFEPYLPLF